MGRATTAAEPTTDRRDGSSPQMPVSGGVSQHMVGAEFPALVSTDARRLQGAESGEPRCSEPFLLLGLEHFWRFVHCALKRTCANGTVRNQALDVENPRSKWRQGPSLSIRVARSVPLCWLQPRGYSRHLTRTLRTACPSRHRILMTGLGIPADSAPIRTV